MKLSVIIVNYNHKDFPKLAINALEKSKTDFDFEVIVVDNKSSDEVSLTFLRKAHEEKRIELIESPENIGFGQGNNLGASKASGKYLFFHNPDVTVQADSLQKMVNYMGSHAEIGVLGSKLVYPSGKIQPSCRRHMNFFDLILNRTFLGRKKLFQHRVKYNLMVDFDHDKISEVDLVTGAAMVIPKHVFEAVGGFDKRYFLFMEDFDLCRMISKKGYKIVYYPETALGHHDKRLSQDSFWKLIRKKVFWYHLFSAAKYFWKWR